MNDDDREMSEDFQQYREALSRHLAYQYAEAFNREMIKQYDKDFLKSMKIVAYQ